MFFCHFETKAELHVVSNLELLNCQTGLHFKTVAYNYGPCYYLIPSLFSLKLPLAKLVNAGGVFAMHFLESRSTRNLNALLMTLHFQAP
jgi:hypothetical protein